MEGPARCTQKKSSRVSHKNTVLRSISYSRDVKVRSRKVGVQCGLNNHVESVNATVKSDDPANQEKWRRVLNRSKNYRL